MSFHIEPIIIFTFESKKIVVYVYTRNTYIIITLDT